MGSRFLRTGNTGRSQSGDKFAKLFLATMQSPAWQALSPFARLLYPWMLLEWRGPRANNNRRISFSVRQAAEALGCNKETARRAFLDLQAKGFLVVTRCASLGAVGMARGHEYEITELGTGQTPAPRKLFRDWKPGRDFPIIKASVNNPHGVGGVKNLEPQLTKQYETPQPQLTKQYTPNLPNSTNEAKNADSLYHSVSHPYLPEGAGKRHVSQPVEGVFVGEVLSFAVIRRGIPIRVGVRTMKSPDTTRNSARVAQT